MKKDFSYVNSEGFTVFTSHYLKMKGTCCRSACLHCPYGFTIKKSGLQFEEVAEKDLQRIQRLLDEEGKVLDARSFWPDNLRWVSLKNSKCGFMLKNHIVIKHLHLFPEFSEQDISRELVESYYFI
jgi:hypothetical protein